MQELPEGWIKPTPKRREGLRDLHRILSSAIAALERASKAENIDAFAIANFCDATADCFIDMATGLRDDQQEGFR